MYSEELEAIIDAALADGEITEKERSVLHRRAIAEGVDPDELDVIIDGRLAKMKKVEKDWLRPMPPKFVPPNKSTKYGELRKCPQCGAVVETASVQCVECGYEFRGIEALSSVKLFSDQLNQIEGNYAKETSNPLSMVTSHMSSIFGVDPRVNRICTFINTFPIPTSKEDLLEFILYLKPKTNTMQTSTVADQQIARAYKAKYKECLGKAKLYFANDPLFKALLEKKSVFGKLFGK